MAVLFCVTTRIFNSCASRSAAAPRRRRRRRRSQSALHGHNSVTVHCEDIALSYILEREGTAPTAETMCGHHTSLFTKLIAAHETIVVIEACPVPAVRFTAFVMLILFILYFVSYTSVSNFVHHQVIEREKTNTMYNKH